MKYKMLYCIIYSIIKKKKNTFRSDHMETGVSASIGAENRLRFSLAIKFAAIGI